MPLTTAPVRADGPPAAAAAPRPDSTAQVFSPDSLPPRLASLLGAMVKTGATDLLIGAGSPPSLRVSGLLEPAANQPVLTAKETREVALALLAPDQRALFEEHHDFDFSFEVSGLARFRCSVYVQRGSVSLALRALPVAIPSLAALGLPPVVAELARVPRGLVIVTGPTGSGKSTTLAAMIDLVNETAPKHLVTIEDPVEFIHRNKKAVVEQREVGADTPSFTRALRGIFRQNPDVILVGEMRDLETIQTVLTLAETGHLTFATLHTNSCANTVHRLVDAFPVDQQPQVRAQLGLTLEGVISQALLPRRGGGLALATEVMVGTPAIRNLIREGKAHQIYAVIQAGQPFGMRTLNQSLAELINRRQVTLEEALARSPDPRELQALLRG
jgi:twitching motility protein PilT